MLRKREKGEITKAKRKKRDQEKEKEEESVTLERGQKERK